jgi:ParB-like chromosome segregation protein Spo0J
MTDPDPAILAYDLPPALVCAERPSAEPPRPAPAITRLPRAARALAQAHELKRLLDEDASCHPASLARALGTSRARVSQLLDLLLLAPDIQEEILFLEVPTTRREPVSEHKLRRIVREPDWTEQRRLWRPFRSLT